MVRGEKPAARSAPLSVRYNYIFINFYYHTAIFFVYNLIIRYLIVVVDSLSMVVKCKILKNAFENVVSYGRKRCFHRQITSYPA